jgi:hypothetical protein
MSEREKFETEMEKIEHEALKRTYDDLLAEYTKCYELNQKWLKMYQHLKFELNKLGIDIDQYKVSEN